MAIGATDTDSHIITHYLGSDHGQCFALVGFTLPGIMEEPGSLSGMNSSPIPAAGPEDSIRISLAIFMRLTATVFKAPWAPQ